MACNKQLTNLINLDFSTTNDGFNWFNNSNVPITTVDGKMKLKAQNSSTFFRRAIGVLSSSKNRIRVKSNLEVFRPQTSSDGEICVVFTLFAGNTEIDKYTLYEDNLTNGERVDFYFDREYKYSNLSGDLFLTITIPQGFGNELFLLDLSVDNKIFCTDDIRTYFALKDVFTKAFSSMAVGLRLKEYKINNLETLTSAFFNETLNVGGSKNGWYFGKAGLDGENRVAEVGNPNTFNIFERDCNLIFDTTNSFHGGKPTGTQSGNSYGDGILNIGYDKPEVLNSSLVTQKGVFFIDIDYTQNLRVVFDVIVNTQNASLFNSPTIYRTYVIEVDSTKCTRSFYYMDLLEEGIKITDNVNGFLSGISGGVSSQEFVNCGDVLSYSGKGGSTEFKINIGTAIGNAGLNYNTTGVPANFVVEWNGQTFSTGYVGPSNLNQELINSGVLQSEINTAAPTNGQGELRFNKNQQNPTTATIRVLSPLDNTNWEITTVCPNVAGGAPSGVIGEGTCVVDPTISRIVYFDTTDINLYMMQNGDVIYTDSGLATPFDGGGLIYRFRIDEGSTWKDFQFQLSATGVVSTLTFCSQGTGDISTNNLDISNCQTIWSITVNVPTGQSRVVSFQSNFEGIGRYSEYDDINNRNVNIFQNTTETITESKTYIFGVTGNNNIGLGLAQASLISLEVTNPVGNTFVASDSYGRLHNNSVCTSIII